MVHRSNHSSIIVHHESISVGCAAILALGTSNTTLVLPKGFSLPIKYNNKPPSTRGQNQSRPMSKSSVSTTFPLLLADRIVISIGCHILMDSILHATPFHMDRNPHAPPFNKKGYSMSHTMPTLGSPRPLAENHALLL
eukprot:Gb_37676 [translate_table: standard]